MFPSGRISVVLRAQPSSGSADSGAEGSHQGVGSYGKEPTLAALSLKAQPGEVRER